jgi:diguanylate cyclase (GGDEF)-like protein
MSDKTILSKRSRSALLQRDPDARIPTLVVLEGPRLGHYVQLTEEQRSLQVGRDETAGAELVLPDPSVSRNHCRFFVDDHGSAWVQDNGSTNGVQVNGAGVQRHRLKHGDKVRLGNSLLRFDLLDATELRYQEQLREKVQAGERDSLTGCLTRGGLEQRLVDMVAAHDAGGPAPACILFDLDRFKAINDNLGHHAGDQVLAASAGSAQTAVRDRDQVCRWGGEEFLVVLPGQDAGAAVEVAQRMQDRIRDLRFDSWPALRVTASFGVASRMPNESIVDWVERADIALYAAKEAGRDCIRLATWVGPAAP